MKKYTFVAIVFGIFLVLSVNSAYAALCWDYDGDQAACENTTDTLECNWFAAGDSWCPSSSSGCCEMIDCPDYDGDKSMCEGSGLGCTWNGNQYNENMWCPVSASDPYTMNGSLATGTDIGCCGSPGCMDADGTNQTYCDGSDSAAFMSGVCEWMTKTQNPYCPAENGCCGLRPCGNATSEANCTLLINEGSPCSWASETCSDSGYGGYNGADSCVDNGGYWNGTDCTTPTYGDEANVHCWFADFRPGVCTNVTGCTYCNSTQVADSNSICNGAQVGWCQGHESTAGIEELPTDSVSCEDIMLGSACDCGPVPGCQWNVTNSSINGTFCSPGVSSCDLNVEDLAYDKCEDAQTNSTACNIMKNTYFMPCKFNDGTGKCEFDWQSGGGFGDSKGDSNFEFWDLKDQDSCTFAGGMWQSVTIDAYGNTEGWCEFGFGAGMDTCDNSCWACELQDNGQPWANAAAAQTACEASAAGGGDCEFISFGGSADPSGRYGWCDYPMAMDFFGGGSCNSSCYDCFGEQMCTDSGANCTWVSDPMGYGPGWCDPTAVAAFMNCSYANNINNSMACMGEESCAGQGFNWTNQYVNDPFTGTGIYICILNATDGNYTDPEICFIPGDEDSDGDSDCADSDCSMNPMCGFGMGNMGPGGPGGGMMLPPGTESTLCFSADDTNQTYCGAIIVDAQTANGTHAYNDSHRISGVGLPSHLNNTQLCFYHAAPSGASETNWCDPIFDQQMMGGMDMGKPPTPIGNDPTGDADSLNHLDIVHVGIMDEPQNMDLGIPLVNFNDSALCNDKVGGTDNITVYRYIDSDTNTSTGCTATDGTYDGFDYKMVISGTYNVTGVATTTTAAYRCVNSTSNTWSTMSASLTFMDDACFASPPPGEMMAMIGMSTFNGVNILMFSKSDFGVSTSDLKVLVATVGDGYNETNVTDEAGPFYYTPGAIDFETEDCFGFVDMDGDGFTPGQDPDCKFINNLGFIPFEDCGDDIDNNADGMVDCVDPMCQYTPICAGGFGYAANASDTTSPNVIFHKVETFHDSAFIKFDTNEPANGTVLYYKTDSTCTQVNRTLSDIGDPGCVGDWCDYDDYKLWHDVPLDNSTYTPAQWRLVEGLTNATAYFYKYKVCDPSDNCAISSCSNFTTENSVKQFYFGLSAPSGATVVTPWAPSGQTYSTQVNSSQTKDINITIDCSASGYSMELIGVDIKGAKDFDMSNMTCDATSKLVGMDSDTWDQMLFDLSVDWVEITWALSSGTQTIYHCDDDGSTNCVDVTTYLQCTTSGSSLTCKIPTTLGFSTYKLTETVATTAAASTSSSSGGSSLSTVTGAYTKKFDSINAYSAKTITELNLAGTDTMLTEVYIDVVDRVTYAEISILKISSLPEEVPEPTVGVPAATVYRYIDITPTKITDDNIEAARMQFKIAKSWINDNSIDRDTIAMYRYADDEWNELTTKQISSDDNYLYFEADVPGFSYFAIMAETTGAVAEEEAEEAATTTTLPSVAEATTTTLPPSLPAMPEQVGQVGLQTWIILGIIILIVFGIGYYLKYYK